MNDLKVTIIQADLAWENKEENINKFSSFISEIKEETDLIILPEMFSTGFTMKAEKLAEDFKGKTVQWMKDIAKDKNAVLIGSIIIKVRELYYNRLVIMHSNGNIEYYDKRHLFRMGNEHYVYTQGKKKHISDVDGWKIRPLICYDIRFPVWSRNENDYDVLIYIANWPENRRDAWLTLLMARAIENQCYVIGVNRVGQDGNAISYSGDSVVINPKGKIISKTKAYKESVETLNLSISELTEFRQKFPVDIDADKFNII